MATGPQAQQKLYRAIARGDVVRQPCEVCGRTPVDAHHRWGYDDPLRVAWLCRTHHAREHNGSHPGPRRLAILAELRQPDPPTQAEVARKYGVTRQRVSEIIEQERRQSRM